VTEFDNCMFCVGCLDFVSAILKVRVRSSVGIFNIHIVFVLWVFIKDSNKGWWVIFGRTLENYIYILQYKLLLPLLSKLCALFQEFVLPPHTVRVMRFSCILGIWESVCSVMPNNVCWSSWEKDQTDLTPLDS
jgi:hypothetical protein